MTRRIATAKPRKTAKCKTPLESDSPEKRILRALLDCIPDPAVVVYGKTAAIVYGNAAAARWYGGSEASLAGKPFQSICDSTDATSRDDWLTRVQVYGQIFAEQTFRLADGKIVRADISASTLKGKGCDDLVIAILRDAESRLAAQQLEVRSREIAARLATVERLNHEINNPLQALIMRSTCRADPEIQHQVDAIARVVRELRNEESGGLPKGAPTVPPPASPGMPADENRFLLADDSDVIRTSLSILLSMLFPGVRIDTAADGKEALAMFKQYHPAVMVLDMVMPKKTGDEVFAEIQQHCRDQRWEEPRIAFCTGYTPPPTVMAAVRNSGRHICLLKPIPPDDIIKAIEQLARRKAARK